MGKSSRVSQRVALVRPVRRAEVLRFVLFTLLLYGLVYHPYPASGWASATLAAHLGWVARASAWLISLVDRAVYVERETTIVGSFPLQIALDCAALDVQALYLAAVCAFSAPWRIKLVGALVGMLLLSGVNVLRIVLLYFVGTYAPGRFDLLHEDVLTFAMMTVTCIAFAAFAVWASNRPATMEQVAPLAGPL